MALEHILRAATKRDYVIVKSGEKYRLIKRDREGHRFWTNLDDRKNGSASKTILEMGNSECVRIMPALPKYKRNIGELLWLPQSEERPHIVTLKYSFEAEDEEESGPELDAYFDELIQWELRLNEAKQREFLRTLSEYDR